ncbi:hypothetical protein [Alkalihalophilus marmarensis]|uniref:hypothetical protein n=1 Tax=Alkalihalophilus marmarensis TaxID=521377 RepID=UPI002DBD1DEB|nr:hypothetical protein [Alkalihalophilus marmarensis]MEC2072173.1 hypothetical protein [Alkalihalophilus marmarensis]
MPYFRIILTGIAKLLSKVFSMATLTFFGRIPSQDDSKVSFMGLLSLYWIYILVTTVFPDLAETFIPLMPDDDTIVRIASIVLILLIPLINGYISTRMENRDPDCSKIKQTLMGYPYTLILGGMSMILLILIPLIKLPNILQMHSQQQFAIMIRKGKYDDVLKEVEETLKKHQIKTYVHDPKKLVWYNFIMLSYVLEHIFNFKIAKKMKYITAELEDNEVEITVHATDISIVGPRQEVCEVKHILSEEMRPVDFYFTWDHGLQKLEDQIQEMRHELEDGSDINIDKLEEITEELRKSSLGNEDWNAMRRQIYKLECDYYKWKYEECHEGEKKESE